MSTLEARIEELKHANLQLWQKQLLRAADYIDKYGMIRGHFGSKGHAACLRGAIAFANGFQPASKNEMDLSSKVADYLLAHKLTPSWRRCAGNWNNVYAKDAAEVSSILRATALEGV